MPPFQEYSSWFERASDNEKPIEPKKKYVFLCEGANTERLYFERLKDSRKELGFNPLIDISVIEKTGEDTNLSAPMRLIERTERLEKDPKIKFRKNTDRFVVVFDLDRFCTKQAEYKEILVKGDERGVLLGVTNPNFELFLLLHHENAFRELIVPHERELTAPKRTGKRHYSEKLFSDTFGMNPKSNPKVGELALKVDVAIEEEKKINQDLTSIKCFKRVTSNIGKLLESIRNEVVR